MFRINLAFNIKRQAIIDIIQVELGGGLKLQFGYISIQLSCECGIKVFLRDSIVTMEFELFGFQIIDTVVVKVKLIAYDMIVTLYSTNRGLEQNVKKGVEMLTVDIEKIPFFQDGVKRGIEKGIFDTAIVMIEKFNLSIDEIAKELNIKKEELLEYMKQKKK